MKRTRVIILGVVLVALCAGFAFACERLAASFQAIGMRLAYYEGPVPPLTEQEIATIKESTGGIFLKVFAVELVVLGAVLLLGYWFSRLTSRGACDTPTPWSVWGIRLSLVWEGAAVGFRFILRACIDIGFHSGDRGYGALVLMLALVTAVVGGWATLGIARWSKLTLLVCLALLALYEFAPLVFLVFLRASDPGLHMSAGFDSLRGPSFLAGIVLVMRSRRIDTHFRSAVAKAQAA